MTTKLTEAQIDLRVKKITEQADQAFVNGDLTNEQYTNALRNLKHWAEQARKQSAVH